MEASPSVDTMEDIVSRLGSLTDLEAIDECLDIINSGSLKDRSLARAVIEAGLARGEAVARDVQAKVASSSSQTPITSSLTWTFIHANAQDIVSAINQAVGTDEELRKLVTGYGLLHQARSRLNTYDSVWPARDIAPPIAATSAELATKAALLPDPGEDVELDDPWAEIEVDDTQDGSTSPVIEDPWETGSSESAPQQTTAQPLVVDAETDPDNDDQSDPPISLAESISQSIVLSAMSLAASASLRDLKTLSLKHIGQLYPYRYAILESLPSWVSPGDVKEQGLLPSLGDEGLETDWVKKDDEENVDLFDAYPRQHIDLDARSIFPHGKSADELSTWFVSRVDSLDDVGMLDLQLAWVQHGASVGVPHLDALGEDLSLLSRLIYDAHLTPAQHEKWTLAAWRTASESDIVAAYLSNSTPSTIVADIRRLVLPYLYVLESRAERAGKPDTHLVERLLHDAVLSLSLYKVLPIFEASKATLPMPERLIRNDQNVARLALACLYGSDEKEVWSTMSSIFECLPVWDVSGGDLESDKEATATTLDSIATFVRPTTSSVKPPSAKDLFIFFSPLPFASLSRALDILDVHLESGEILARWETAVQLRFLLQSARDKDEQLQLAEKMVRRQAGSLGPERWPKLWDDMLRLSGGDDALLRGAFGMLSIEDMMKVYLGGVLSSGSEFPTFLFVSLAQIADTAGFDVARKMIRRFEIEHDLLSASLEQVALVTSRELYDNAETGNIHTGEMKIAYDWSVHCTEA